MEAEIKKTENGIEIDVTELNGKKEQLLEAFQECSEGWCTCPTNEYQKVQKLDVIGSEDAIQLSITTKPDQQIDTAEIEKCLEHTRRSACPPRSASASGNRQIMGRACHPWNGPPDNYAAAGTPKPVKHRHAKNECPCPKCNAAVNSKLVTLPSPR